MSFGVLSGFNSARIVTTAATTVTTDPSYMTARLVAGAAAIVLRIYNGSTAAASQVAILKAAANSADELGTPLRCDLGVRVLMSANTGTAFIYTR